MSLPKKCRTEESAKYLIKVACSIKVKKLKKYECDFTALKGMHYVFIFLIVNSITIYIIYQQTIIVMEVNGLSENANRHEYLS